MIQFKKLTTTLPSGTNSYTFTDALINDASVIEVYTDNDDVYPVNLEQHGNNIDITLSDHADAVGVALTINNVVTYEPTDISGLENEIQTVSDNLSGLSTVVNELSDNVDNIEGDVSTLGTMVTDLETSKQDVLTAGENITIENNVISSTGGASTPFSIISVTDVFEPLNSATIMPRRSFCYSNGELVFGNILVYAPSVLTTSQILLAFKEAYKPLDFPTSGTGFIGTSGNEFDLRNPLYTFIGVDSGKLVIRLGGTGRYAMLTFYFIKGGN